MIYTYRATITPKSVLRGHRILNTCTIKQPKVVLTKINIKKINVYLDHSP